MNIKDESENEQFNFNKTEIDIINTPVELIENIEDIQTNHSIKEEVDNAKV